MKQNKISTLLVFSAIVLFWAGPIFAQDLEVEFEKTPLFDEANFLPGQSVSRWVKVTNNSGEPQRVAAEAINFSDPDRFGDVLMLEITEGSEIRYKNDLSRFFNEGEVYLSDLAAGSNTTYNFSVSFYPEAGNPFQDRSLSFDILVGFQGEEGGLPPGAGGGGGGYLPPGLTIKDEATVEIGETTVVITWLTSYFSTSQVIYAEEGESHTLDLTDNTGTPPKYGYAQTTPEYDTSPKVTFHSVTISGLTPGTKYYYRCVSHASLAISQEHSFTTLGAAGEEEEEPVQISEEIETGREEKEKEKEKEKVVVGAISEEEKEKEKEEEFLEGPEMVKIEEKEIEEKEKPGLGWLLAAIGGLFKLKNLWWVLLVFVIIIIILFLLSRKNKSKEE